SKLVPTMVKPAHHAIAVDVAGAVAATKIVPTKLSPAKKLPCCLLLLPQKHWQAHQLLLQSLFLITKPHASKLPRATQKPRKLNASAVVVAAVADAVR